jgi:putative membrane protein insertion efficiency factor
MRTMCVAVIAAYRFCISPWLGPACRFEPTCSKYACDAINHFGVMKGGGLAIWRLLKCHPLHPGGYDPIQPESGSQRIGD